MNNFVYDNPTKILFGRDAEAQVGAEVAALAKKVLLLYGGGSIKKSGLYDRVTASLRGAGVSFVELAGVQPNPLLSLVYEGIALCKKEGVELILAVGGGSVIDTAKAIGLGAVYEGDVWDFFCGRDFEKTLPTGVVLTIPAAGSESSMDAVITKEEGMLKRASCGADGMRPRFAILNPELTFTLPPYQTFAGVCDIMAHIMERYFTNTRGVSVSDHLCEGLLRSVMQAAQVVLRDPTNYDARAEIMWAGTLAHNNICGVDREGDWSCHTMGHEISGLYNATHGATLALLFPYWMEYVRDHDLPRAMQFASRVMGVEYDPEYPDHMALEGIRRLRDFFTSVGMPSTYQEMGIDRPDIDTMVKKCTDGGAETVGGYRPLSALDVGAIYQMGLR